MSWSLPTARNCPSLTATAVTLGLAASKVVMRPLMRIRSARLPPWACGLRVFIAQVPPTNAAPAASARCKKARRVIPSDVAAGVLAFLRGSEIARHEVSVVRNVVREERAQTFNVVAPVAVQFAGHAKPVHQLRAGSLHPQPGAVAGNLIAGARGVGDHENVVSLLNGGKRREGHAGLSNWAGNDELLAASLLDRFDEVLVIPGVNVPRTRNVGRVREHLLQFRHQRPVRAVLETRGQNRG